MLANIDKQIASARMELDSLRKSADARLTHQRRMEQIARQQAEAEQMRHHRMLQMRNRVNLTRYTDAMRRAPLQNQPANDIAVKKQAFLKHALHQIEIEISKLRAAQKHALDLENSLRQHRSKIMEQQMTLQERRCDFLEALKSLSGNSNSPERIVPTKSPPTPKRNVQTVDLTAKDDEELSENLINKGKEKREGSPTPSPEAMTPPLTPELSLDSVDRAADALAMLGDLAARLSKHVSSSEEPQYMPLSEEEICL